MRTYKPCDVGCHRKMPKSTVIADFGCGEARLASSVSQKVHSFDLVAANPSVTACDIANVCHPNNNKLCALPHQAVILLALLVSASYGHEVI